MFENYTEKARRVLFFARYEASQFGSPYIETEHLLLGLLRETHTAVKRFLGSAISQESIREQVEGLTPIREKDTTGVDLPFTNECKRVLEYAAEEAQRLADDHVGTEHLLLGMLREESCFGARMLQERGADLDRIRREIASSPPPVCREQGDGGPQSVVGSPADETKTTQFVERRRQPRTSLACYSEKARRALFFARFEASQFGTPKIEIEHLLLGLLREAKAYLYLFAEPVTSLHSIRAQIEQHTPRGNNISLSVDLPFSEESKRAISEGAEEAERLHRDTIGPEHLLMGILRQEQSYAAQILRERGADLEQIRKRLAEAKLAS